MEYSNTSTDNSNKLTISFTTSDEMEAKRYLYSLDMVIVLWNFLSNTRREYLKHKGLNEDEYKIAESIFNDLSDELTSRGIIIDSLIE